MSARAVARTATAAPRSRLHAVLQAGLAARTAPIGVYEASPPDIAKLGPAFPDSAHNPEGRNRILRTFDLLGPALAVDLRRRLFVAAGKVYEYTPEDNEEMRAFLVHVYEETLPRLDSFEEFIDHTMQGANRYVTFYSTVFGLVSTPIASGGGHEIAAALWELHVYFIRYVWNFKFPDSEAPIDVATREKGWHFLQSVFNPVNRFYMKRVTRFMEFSPWGTPNVLFPPTWHGVLDRASYEILISWWRNKARQNLQVFKSEAERIARLELAKKSFLDLYHEVYWRPGNQGMGVAKQDFDDAQGVVENLKRMNEEVDEREEQLRKRGRS